MSELEPELRGMGVEEAGEEAAQSDQILHLHKMSTTAGVMNSDYVAINPTAVATLMVSLASVLVFLTYSWVLAIVPLLAIFLGGLSLYQIQRSGATQSGKWLAIGGLAIAGGIIGTRFCIQVIDWNTSAKANRDLTAVMHDLAGDLAKDDYDKAYGLLSDRFRHRVSKDLFADNWKRWQLTNGHVKSIDSNGVIELDDSERGKTAATISEVALEKTTTSQQIMFVDEGSGFQVDEWQLFPDSAADDPNMTGGAGDAGAGGAGTPSVRR